MGRKIFMFAVIIALSIACILLYNKKEGAKTKEEATNAQKEDAGWYEIWAPFFHMEGKINE